MAGVERCAERNVCHKLYKQLHKMLPFTYLVIGCGNLKVQRRLEEDGDQA
jgi:hypothetical protein